MVVDEAALRARCAPGGRRSTARLPRARITFASKAFPCTAVYRLMAEEGVGVDVAGGGELALALRRRRRHGAHASCTATPRATPRSPRRTRPASA